MKTIRNKTYKPLKITFSGGKVLHLGPGKTGQIPDGALQQKSVRALVESASIEILDGGPAHAPDGAATGSTSQETTRGHRPSMTVPTKGQRGA